MIVIMNLCDGKNVISENIIDDEKYQTNIMLISCKSHIMVYEWRKWML